MRSGREHLAWILAVGTLPGRSESLVTEGCWSFCIIWPRKLAKTHPAVLGSATKRYFGTVITAKCAKKMHTLEAIATQVAVKGMSHTLSMCHAAREEKKTLLRVIAIMAYIDIYCTTCNKTNVTTYGIIIYMDPKNDIKYEYV